MQKHVFAGNLVDAFTSRINGEVETISFTLAANEGQNQNTGEKYVTFMPVVVSGKVGFADGLKPYLVKGKGITVNGESYVARNEKGDDVYDNPGIRLRGLRNSLSLSGEAAMVAPADMSGEKAPVSQEQQEAQKAEQQLSQQANSEPAGDQPSGDFDHGDDEIPF